MSISGAGVSGAGSAGGSVSFKSYSFQSIAGGGATNYTAGFYELVAADLNLTQASLTGTAGAANVPYGAHAIAVTSSAGGATGGTTGVGVITVSGTSVTDAGVRTGGDSEVIIADNTAVSVNDYYETSKKWVGQVTYTLSQSGDRTTYNQDFNVGFAKYEDFGNRNFTVSDFEAAGLGGAAGSLDVALIEHSAANWTYHATAFVAPTANDIVSLTTTYTTETDVDGDVPFAFKRTGLTASVAGSLSVPTTTSPNGVLIQIVTGAGNVVRSMDAHIGITYT